MIRALSSTAMFWIGITGIVLSVILGTIIPVWIGPYQANGSPTLGQIIGTIPIATRIMEGIGYSFVAGAFVVRHFEKREAVDARRSVHFVGRAARKDEH